MTPPNVDGAPNPTSSVMISRMFGAPFGGTTRAGQPGFDWSTLRLIWPSNFGGGGGRYRPSIVVVASGEPGTPVVCCAAAGADMVAPTNKATSPRRMFLLVLTGATPLLLTLEGN